MDKAGKDNIDTGETPVILTLAKEILISLGFALFYLGLCYCLYAYTQDVPVPSRMRQWELLLFVYGGLIFCGLLGMAYLLRPFYLVWQKLIKKE